MLPIRERLKKRNEVQRDTIEQILKIWNNGSRSAVMIRPTGFGKTYTVARLLSYTMNGQRLFKKVLFIYPMNVIAHSLIEDIHKVNAKNRKAGNTAALINISKDKEKDVDLLSYAAVARNISEFSDKQTLKVFSKYDLIVFDEFHCTGAEKTLIGCNKIFAGAVNAKALGMTATFIRMDGVNQAIEVFGELNTIPVYTYTDAVEDGLMPKLSYYDVRYYKGLDENGVWVKDTVDNLKKIVNDMEIDVNNISSQLVVENSISNFGAEIRHSVIKTLGQDAYTDGMQRWICFFSTTKDIELKKQEVLRSFQSAFPNRKIKMLVVATDTTEHSKNIELLGQKYDETGKKIHNDWIEPDKDTVVVILSVNMLNMGYHTGHVTGIVLYRQTKSNIVYQQEIGRSLNMSRETEPIIIDLAGALDSICLSSAVRATTKSSKTDKDTENNIGTADYFDRRCLSMQLASRSYMDFAKKMNDFRYHDIFGMITRALLKSQNPISKETIINMAKRYHTLPKYMYMFIKDTAEKGEIRLVETIHGGLGGAKAEKVKVTPEMLAKIDSIFEGLL